jgi:hypothetical protein
MYYQERSGNTEGRDKSRGGHPDFEETYYPPYPPYRDEDWMRGRMYYEGRNNSSGNGSSSSGSTSSNGGGTRNYSEREMPFGENMRDRREGRSPMSRKSYMESKEMHKDKAASL